MIAIVSRSAQRLALTNTRTRDTQEEDEELISRETLLSSSPKARIGNGCGKVGESLVCHDPGWNFNEAARIRLLNIALNFARENGVARPDSLPDEGYIDGKFCRNFASPKIPAKVEAGEFNFL